LTMSHSMFCCHYTRSTWLLATRKHLRSVVPCRRYVSVPGLLLCGIGIAIAVAAPVPAVTDWIGCATQDVIVQRL
jgi:hypothetical protein